MLIRRSIRYGLAVVTVAAALLLRYYLLYSLHLELPLFILLSPAVMLVAIFAGFGAGILATALAALGADYLFVPPYGKFGITRLSDLISLLIFAALGILMSLMGEYYRRNEQSKQRNEAKRHLSDMLRLSYDAIMVVESTGAIESWNWGAEQLYGYKEEEVHGDDPHELLKTSPAVPWPEIFSTLRELGSWERELRQTTRDGRVVMVATRYQLVGGRAGAERILKIGRDITERKQAEAHIHRLTRVYAVLSDINQIIVREKNSTAMLQAACRIAVEQGKFQMAWTGIIDPATQVLKPIASTGAAEGYLDHLRIDLRSQADDNRPCARCIHSGEHAVCNDIENDLPDPRWRDDELERGYRSSAAFPLKVDGQVVGVISFYTGELDFFADDELKLLDEMAMDIGFALEVNRREEERRKTEEELRRRTALFEALVDSSLDGLLVVDNDGKRILQNQRFNELLKIPADMSEIPNDAPQLGYVRQLMKHQDEFSERISHLIAHPEEVSRDEIELLDGTILDRYSSPVRDKALHYYGRIWSFRDITAQRQLEQQFQQAQKMEAIGQLTGGIAHDFNNLLTVILGCSETIGEEIGENPRLQKMVTMIGNAARRGADLTHRMLAFARRQTLQPRPVNIRHLLADMEDFLRRTLSSLSGEVALNIEGDGEDCVAIIDPTQLENALLNLCVNARDAMPEGGTLTIAVEKATLDAAYTQQNAEIKPGEYIRIAISDTGCGIHPEILPRVFDPFFTTKEVGKGTGLGLSMVYGFVKQSQGHVKIYSEPGQGTTVKLYLPYADRKSEPAKAHPAPAASVRGTEVILLAEDDDSVREFAKSQLDGFGYRVFAATNGKDALKILNEHEEINLLFTDMIMPGGMNGRELAEAACKLRPQLKVLFCSGHARNAAINQGLLEMHSLLLDKPYSRMELAQAIRRALTET
jgi:PAS domain S-box-containing protein